ncbi:asparagine synthetase domain-containing protein 1 [Patella vulgata]|uniref:asparagine synthetase domain-containing protein 1 n=1 Tax=Patella vulgata TaxID=6465 RepID=UPI00217FE723|nr:asparagine synthetase domain-containing protein 1 [Patella vulgata]
MCGICCILYSGKNENNPKCLEGSSGLCFLGARGPDLQTNRTIELNNDFHLQLAGYVLHLRGQPTPQPLTNKDGDSLLWNGEIFGGIEVKEEENDTQVLFSRLTESVTNTQLLHVVEQIEGPWAFIYWQSKKKKLWFGRDRFGRRSLLWHLPATTTDAFMLTSVTILSHEFYELPSIGVFCLDLSENDPKDSNLNLELFPWKDAKWPGTNDCVDNDNILQSNIYPVDYSNIQISIDKTTKINSWIPSLNMEIPSDDFKSVDLNNMTSKEYLHSLLQNSELLKKSAEQFVDILEKAVKKRIFNLPRESVSHHAQNPCSHLKENVPMNKDASCERESSILECGKAKVAILFSGGIDSAIITALADRCVPVNEPIDLLNVAFEQLPKAQPNTVKRGKQSVQAEVKDKFSVPDRLTGYTALAELNPNRCWNFVEINVTQEELKDVRSRRVRHLVYPSCTVLDDSIGCAIWFAARGQGIMGNGKNKGERFSSTARVILCGMGADEQLAGYSRHRSRYSEGKWDGLLQEIKMEMQRISARNLGRDDRIIGDHGKEARFPFLDEKVVQHLSSLPIHIKAQLDLPRGLGEKLLLRLSAYSIGLLNTSCFPKRAIQFGSRIAKLENNKEKASEKCERLTGE